MALSLQYFHTLVTAMFSTDKKKKKKIFRFRRNKFFFVKSGRYSSTILVKLDKSIFSEYRFTYKIGGRKSFFRCSDSHLNF